MHVQNHRAETHVIAQNLVEALEVFSGCLEVFDLQFERPVFTFR